MTKNHEDICPRPDTIPRSPATPFAAPIYPASVYQCDSTDQAESLLSGETAGFVYQRDGHPNAEMFAAKCRDLHRASNVAVTSSGMAAMALAVLSQLQANDHVVVSRQLYGRSLQLLSAETERLGIAATCVDTSDLEATAEAITPSTRMVVVETIGNPLLQVANIGELAGLAHRNGALLLVDNTFATPALCRPLELGADLVLESVSKMMNGHSDVMLGMLAGGDEVWSRVPLTLSAWGLASSAFDCWLAARGLGTLHLRVQRACENALAAARYLDQCAEVEAVVYPGLPEHADHRLATRQFSGQYGSIVTFHLKGGRAAADQFIKSAKEIPFCPSLGELSTTLSHPESTSHRGLSPEQRAALGISGGTIRLSVGCESSEFILAALSAVT